MQALTAEVVLDRMVRAVQDVRDRLLRATAALDSAKVPYAVAGGNAEAKARDAVHIVFANEKVRPDCVEPAPDVEPHDLAPPFRILPIEPLVRMKLTANRRKDQIHIQDLIGVGSIDATWLPHLPAELAERLRVILEDPEG